MNRAVFLDRDGVINRRAREGEYITRWEDVQLLPGVAEAIAMLVREGFCVIVVTNQRCVAKALLTVSELESIHRQMCQELAAAGAVITEIYFCPHDYQPPCDCRKPAPGMLLTAAREHDIDLSASWMIGDSDIDVESGKRAGCRTARILGSRETARCEADLFAQSLFDVAQQIVQPTLVTRKTNSR